MEEQNPQQVNLDGQGNPVGDEPKKEDAPSIPDYNIPESEGGHGVRNGIIAAIVIVVLVAAGIYFATKGEGEEVAEEENEAVAEEQMENEEEAVEEVIAEEAVEELKEQPEEVKVEGAYKDGKFTEVANNGDGVTHLARRALANFETVAADKVPETFTNEQRIFVEDYLMKNTSTEWLDLGEEVNFSEELVQEAIEQAAELDDAKQANLKQYSVLVFGESA